MVMVMAMAVSSSEWLPKGYSLASSEFGGFYFEIGEEGSEDYRSRRQAAIAAREHARSQRLLPKPDRAVGSP